MDAYFAYVEDEGGAFRLVFESDLTNEPAVRERVDKVGLDCARPSARSSPRTPDLPRDQSMLLAVGLCGMAQITARYWLGSGQQLPAGRRGEAALLAVLARHRGLPDASPARADARARAGPARVRCGLRPAAACGPPAPG